jgi:hypothetical protein
VRSSRQKLEQIPHQPKQQGRSNEWRICMECGGKVRQLTQREAVRSRLSILEESCRPVRAYSCRNCETLLYEDELTYGKFVPPRLKGYLLSERAWSDS